MQLTTIEYNAIMEAINNAKAAIADGEFIDPYGEIPDGYSNETLLEALEQVERKIMSYNVPY